MSDETPFEKIARETIEAAERVPCKLSEFYAGLRDIKIAIEDRLAVESEDGET